MGIVSYTGASMIWQFYFILNFQRWPFDVMYLIRDSRPNPVESTAHFQS